MVANNFIKSNKEENETLHLNYKLTNVLNFSVYIKNIRIKNAHNQVQGCQSAFLEDVFSIFDKIFYIFNTLIHYNYDFKNLVLFSKKT